MAGQLFRQPSSGNESVSLIHNKTTRSSRKKGGSPRPVPPAAGAPDVDNVATLHIRCGAHGRFNFSPARSAAFN